MLFEEYVKNCTTEQKHSMVIFLAEQKCPNFHISLILDMPLEEVKEIAPDTDCIRPMFCHFKENSDVNPLRAFFMKWTRTEMHLENYLRGKVLKCKLLDYSISEIAKKFYLTELQVAEILQKNMQSALFSLKPQRGYLDVYELSAILEQFVEN